MKSVLGLLLGVTTWAAMPSPVLAAAEELAPSSDWSLDYADDNCALRRTFGEGEDLVWLEIMQLAPGTPMRITVASTDFPRRRRKAVLDRAPVLRFLPGGTEGRYGLVAFGEYGEGLQGLAVYASIQSDETPSPGSGTYSLVASIDGRPVPGHSSTSDAIELVGAFERDVLLRTGNLQRPLAALRTCMADLARQWDVATAKGIAISQAPVARDQNTWAKPIMSSFPRGLRRFGGPTYVRARVIVGADGKAEQCRIIEPVVDADYERRTCGTILTRGQYEPARDAAGAPVREMVIQHIAYVLQTMPTAARRQ